MTTAQLDQHFLKDSAVIQKMVEATEIKSTDIVLEIGPGTGNITREIAKQAQKVIAVERDESLKAVLSEMPKNVEVRFGNALEMIARVQGNKIIANLPFSLSEPFFSKLIKKNFDRAVLLLGKHFYQLFSSEGKWNIIGRVFFDIEKIMDVPRIAFEPKPRTDAVLVLIKKRATPLTEQEQLIKEVLLQDDKKLKNALLTAFKRAKKLAKKEAKDRMQQLGIPEKLLQKNVAYLSNQQWKLIWEKL